MYRVSMFAHLSVSKFYFSSPFKTIILPVILYGCLYGCETSSVVLREEWRLKVFENRIPRRIFGPKRDENGEWRRLHNEELHSL